MKYIFFISMGLWTLGLNAGSGHSTPAKEEKKEKPPFPTTVETIMGESAGDYIRAEWSKCGALIIYRALKKEWVYDVLNKTICELQVKIRKEKSKAYEEDESEERSYIKYIAFLLVHCPWDTSEIISSQGIKACYKSSSSKNPSRIQLKKGSLTKDIPYNGADFLSWSPDGNFLACLTIDSKDTGDPSKSYAHVYRITPDLEALPLSALNTKISSASFLSWHHKSKLIAALFHTPSGSTFSVFRAQTGRELLSFPCSPYTRTIHFNPKNDTLLSDEYISWEKGTYFPVPLTVYYWDLHKKLAKARWVEKAEPDEYEAPIEKLKVPFKKREE